MDDQIIDLLPATIPQPYVALVLVAVLVWEHVLAETEIVRANSTIRLVGDMVAAALRRITRKPPVQP